MRATQYNPTDSNVFTVSLFHVNFCFTDQVTAKIMVFMKIPL